MVENTHEHIDIANKKCQPNWVIAQQNNEISFNINHIPDIKFQNMNFPKSHIPKFVYVHIYLTKQFKHLYPILICE